MCCKYLVSERSQQPMIMDLPKILSFLSFKNPLKLASSCYSTMSLFGPSGLTVLQ